MGRPSCSKVSAHRALAGSGELNPQRDPQEDGADERFVPEHSALPPWASGLPQGCHHGGKQPEPLVTLAVASWTMEMPPAPYDHQEGHVFLQDLVYTLNGTRPRGEANSSKLTYNLHKGACVLEREREKYT